ncbi:MAG: hypothetical protein IPH58_15570 [Sphingobacteriales bacterium]|jgi:hypothetical protein|nr:hypothetical protein [Sphingobacteriales bacterium]
MLILDRWLLNALIDGRATKHEAKQFKRFEGTTASDLQNAIDSEAGFIANEDDFTSEQREVFFDYLLKLKSEIEAKESVKY